MKVGINTEEPATVVFVVGNLAASGPIMQILYLVSNLDINRVNPVIVVTSATGAPTTIERRLQDEGVEVIRLVGGKLASLISASKMLARIARERGRVVLHPYGFRSDVICALAQVRPRLGNVRNHLRYNYQRRFGPALGRVVSAINLFFLHRADLVIACGSAVQDDLAGLGLDAMMIRNAIDPEIYRSLMCSPAVSEQPRYTVPTYVTVASAIPGKNVEFLVEQFAADDQGRRKLIVLGAIAPQLLSAFSGNLNVEFRGYVPRPGDVLLEAHFFISASEHEGIPNAVLEALTLGRPVVLSEIAPHTEVLGVVGREFGEVFDFTRESLSEALQSIEARPYEALSVGCAKAAKKRLSAAEMALQYEQAYLGCIDT